MTRYYKKLQERAFAFAAGEGLGEDWVLEDVPEPLDFIVKRSGYQSWGLEVTELHDSPGILGGSLLKEMLGKQRRYLREILSGYYDGGGRPVRVNFLGDLSNTNSIVERLLRLPITLSDKEFLVELQDIRFWVLPLPINDPRFVRYSRWQIADAGFVRQISAQLVLQQIEVKSKKLIEYRKKAGEVDLLLVVDRTSNAGRFTVPREIFYPTMGFRRIILLTYPLEVEIIATSLY